MLDGYTFLRLLQCNDSAFPSGAFAFSTGLETLSNEGRIKNREDVQEILLSQIVPRWLAFDRYFLASANACCGDVDLLAAIDHDCHTRNTNAEQAKASRRVGRSLLDAHAKINTAGVGAYRAAILKARKNQTAGYEPVVHGLIFQAMGLDLRHAEIAALNSVITGFVSAAIRLGKLGAIEAQSVLLDVSGPAVAGLDESRPDFPSNFSPLVEIAVMRKASSGASLFAS